MSSSSAVAPTSPDPSTSTSGDPSISTTLVDQLRFIHDTCNEACIHYLKMFTEDYESHEPIEVSDSLLDNARIVDAIQQGTETTYIPHPEELPPDLSEFPVDLILTASVIREAYENPDNQQHEVLYGLYRTGRILCYLLGLPKKAKEINQAAQYAHASDVDLLSATIDKMVEQGEIIPEVKQEERGCSAT